MAYPPSPQQQKRPPGWGAPAGTPGPAIWGSQAAGVQGVGPAAQPAAPATPDFGMSGWYQGTPGSGRKMGSYNVGLEGHTPGQKAPGWAIDTIKNRYTDAMNRTGGNAERAEDDYFGKAESFDARDYAGQAAQGIFDQFMPKLQESIGDLRGQQVGMGRLNTGFATEDEDRLVRGGLEDLNHQIAGLSMDAARLDQQNTQDLGNMGLEYGNRYMDQISGQYDRRVAEDNAKKKQGGGFGKFLGGVAGIASKFI